VSFILDALRKSEHERQRQTGPGLAEVPVAPAKPKSNVWAIAAIALLIVNLLAVGVYLLRRAQPQDTAVATTPASAAPDAATTAAAANPTLATPAATQAPAITQSATAPAPRPAVSEPVNRNPLADEVGGADPSLQAAAAVPEGPPAVTRNGATKRGSVVYAPIPEAGDAPYSEPAAEPAVRAAPAAAPARDALPGADELTARGTLPALHLDLHVYAAQPPQRFIFVNSRKYREGETLAEGPVVEQITADGAVLNFRGSRFKLSSN
jgi:general secretion pathway protein B